MNTHVKLSPIDFPVYEAPLQYKTMSGLHSAPQWKALVRPLAADDGQLKPYCLNIVNKSYKVIQNAQLFEAIHEGIKSQLSEHEINTAVAIDKAAYHGKLCYREYRFPAISTVGDKDNINFRIIIQNGFGGSAIKLHAGAIDMYCTNGMILGEFTSEYAQHTANVQLRRFTDAVQRAVDVFWKNKDMWKNMSMKRGFTDTQANEFLVEHFGERMGAKIFDQYLRECRDRGRSVWALYSALTYYASHGEDERFGLRNTQNDHAAKTMLGREVAVHKLINSADFKELVEA